MRERPSSLGKPAIVVIGGPNGAGKTSLATRLVPKQLNLEQFVNADLIARGLSPFAPSTTAMEAGRLMLRRIHDLASRMENFAFETTLASKSFPPFLASQQGRGYLVHLVYVWLESPDLAVRRVRERVKMGGHEVEEDVVRRRYKRSLLNFMKIYRPMADTWTLCDNSGAELVVVAQGAKDRPLAILEQTTFTRIEKAGETWPLRKRKFKV